MLWHRTRRATLRRAKSGPPRSGRPKGDDGGATWSETALVYVEACRQHVAEHLFPTYLAGPRCGDYDWRQFCPRHMRRA